MEPMNKKGGISVQTEHIFPIIKKWLYSEKDIFLREIVSNAADAVTKLRRLESLGQYDSKGETYRLDVILDPDAKTLTVSDNGIGMTEEELDRYLCQIALSGALEFVQKYENDQQNNGIIGHFGLGFYSSFMVSDTVEVITASYTGAPAVRWVCSSDGSYELSDGERECHGTSVIMHISDEEAEFLKPATVTAILEKYCAFMPVEIFFHNLGEENEKKENAEEKPVNDTLPLWLKAPSECTPEDYKAFYRKVFADYKEPLFWIHINADYPLNFKGILYFPKIDSRFEPIDGQIKLYYNQVFVADNIKEVIPEYLLMLKGVLDCPELPLNVSRSYLQNNAYISKVSAHIVKKVADKLNSLCNTQREDYEKLWNDIRVFTEYTCMRDRKFYDRVKDSLLLELTNGSHVTVTDYLASAKETHENTVYYTTDKALQAQYIAMFEAQGIQVAVLDQPIETQYVTTLESYSDTGVKFLRIDADIAGALKSEEAATNNETLTELFKKVAGLETLQVEYLSLKDGSVPLLLTVSEEARRMEDMMKYFSMGNGFTPPPMPNDLKLTVNTASPIIQKLSALEAEKQEAAASYLYQSALLSQRKLSAEELQKFLAAGYGLLELL